MRRASLIRLYGKIRCTAAASATPIGAMPICQEAGLATLGCLRQQHTSKQHASGEMKKFRAAVRARRLPRDLSLACCPRSVLGDRSRAHAPSAVCARRLHPHSRPPAASGDSVRRPRSKPDARTVPWLVARALCSVIGLAPMPHLLFAPGARARCLYLAPSPCDFWAVLQVVLAWKDAGRRRFPRSAMSVSSRARSKPPRSPDSCQNQGPFSAKPSRSRGVLALGIERLRLRLISGRRCAQWKGAPCQGLLLCVFVR